VNDGFKKFLAASEKNRADAFLAASQRLGANAQYVEKDFWVCWTLDVLYHGLPSGGPRLLFKGGTSLSKGYGLINRFSEDIDITAFREDLKQAASEEELEQLSNNKRQQKLDAIRDACRAWVQGVLREGVTQRVVEYAGEAGRVEIDDTDHDGQTLLVFYPSIVRKESDYARPAVRIECGAKSALDPHGETTIRPYIAEEVADLKISVPKVTTIESTRSFWDKAVIAHGLRRWFERRGELRQEGQRISRHYYDLHCLLNSAAGDAALVAENLAIDCVRHAKLFFDRPDFDLASAQRGSWAIEPSVGMLERLQADYAKTIPMIFGTAPKFEEMMASMKKINDSINQK
jgi:hypothetical protein